MEKVIKIEEEIGEVTLNTKSGKQIKTNAKTTYTIYDSGRKDCHVEILEPLSMFGDTKI